MPPPELQPQPVHYSQRRDILRSRSDQTFVPKGGGKGVMSHQSNDNCSQVASAPHDEGASSITEFTNSISRSSSNVSTASRIPFVGNHSPTSKSPTRNCSSIVNPNDNNKSPPRSNSRTKSDKLTLDWSFLEAGELLGRQHETQLLRDALSRRVRQKEVHPGQQHCSQNNPELILISGSSGSGKTALAKRVLGSAARESEGHFVMGKFDQMKRPEPYAPLVAAMTNFLLQHVLNNQDSGRSTVAENITNILKDEAPSDILVLTSMLPALREIMIGSQGTPQNLSSPDNFQPTTHSSSNSRQNHKNPEQRQKAIFSKFVRACCSRQHPLVLIMDDLQWADRGSLELIETLVLEASCYGLVLVGICRNNEVSLSHEFAVVLRRLEDAHGATITHVQVDNLSLKATTSLVSKVLYSNRQFDDSEAHRGNYCQFVGATIHAKTNGNVLFSMEMLRALYEASVLTPDSPNDVCWGWNATVWASELLHTDDVVDLVIHQIERLPLVCRLLLSTSACLGAELDEFLLLRSMDKLSSHEIQEALSYCVSEGMIVEDPPMNAPASMSCNCGDNSASKHSRTFRFFHDRIQQASYQLIPDNERAQFHLMLGRNFWHTLTDFELSGYIFLVVDQMIRGVEHIAEENEQVELSTLCLQAGQKAVLSSDFRTAIKYFDLGESLLDARRKWVDHYRLVLGLYNAKAETFCCIADFENMEKCVSAIFSNARTFGDKLRGYQLRIFSLGSVGSLSDAILLGLEVLERLGEPNESKNQSMANLVVKLLKVKRMLWRKMDDDILSLPDISDPVKLSALEILNMLFTYCYISDAQLFPFIALRMVKISLKYGVSAISTAAFCAYGVLLCAIGDYDGANRFGQLSITLLERYNSVRREWSPRCFIIYYGMIAHWTTPSRSTFAYLEQAHQVGLESGDIEYAWISHYLYGTHRMIAGDSLVDLEAEYRDVVYQMRCYKQEIWAELSQINHESALMLTGSNDDPIVVHGALHDMGKNSKKLKEIQAMKNLNFDLYFCHACTQSMIVHYHLGDLEQALNMAKRSGNAAAVVPAAQLVPHQAFYDGLTAVTVLRRSKKRLSFFATKHLESRTQSALRMLRKLSKHCKENFYPRTVLLEAELAAYRGNLDKALSKYTLAEELARKGDHFDILGIASEHMGLTLREFGHEERTVAKHLESSCIAYSKWGAWAVVARVKSLLKNQA